MKFCRHCVALSLLGCLPLFAQTISDSKISAHLINSYTPGAAQIVSGHPRVLKILDLGGPMLQAARAYKAGTPQGKIVLRIYTPKSYPITADPAASATDFWTTVLQPPINSLSPSDRTLIDYLEGPNEGDSTPTWQSLQAAQWFNQFWLTLTPLISAAGFKPCIGSIAVGNPGGTPSEIQQSIATFVPALRQARDAGGAWSYHAYTINYTTDVNVEFYYSLRYRQFYTQFAQQYPDLAAMPLILTEGGVDQSGTPATSGWQARGTAADYERWLNWFDHQLALDGYVLGCTLFEIGNPAGWSSFDLEPIGPWLGNYLLAPTNPPAAPAGVAGVANNGVAQISWTSPPANPTTYKVKRSGISGGGYATIATNITGGVTATSYSDNTVTPGSTYYYVATAVNAAGESTNSAQVTIQIPAVNLPDVVITSVSWTPFPSMNGNGVVFRAVVKNQGTAATPAGTVLGVGFVVDGQGTTSWSGNYTSALAPGASVTLTASGSPSGGNTWAATAGFHSLVATVDDVNRFPESNESNNGYTTNLTVYTSGYAINCGGPAAGSFSGDKNFSGGAVFTTNRPIDPALAANLAAPQAVYQSARAGNFTYTFTNLIPAKAYAMRLHFADSVFTNVGSRVFNLSVNGTPGLTNFDIIAEARGPDRALVRRLDTIADASGVVTVQGNNLIGQAQLNGVELLTTNGIVNGLPVFLPVPDQVVNPNTTVTNNLHAVDPDEPVQTLRYGVGVGGPFGMAIDPVSGRFTWTPGLADAGTNRIFVQVTDGIAVVSGSFLIIVPPPPRFSSIAAAAGGTVPISIETFPGKDYRLEFKDSLSDSSWQVLTNFSGGSGPFRIDAQTGGASNRFFRVVQAN